MLNEQPVDHALGLGDARPIWIRFETEAPVDDVLIATSAGGFIAVQAKTTVELSARPGGGLARTVQQFVRQWLICRDGTGAQLWDRPLEPERDRLVLAVSSNSPASVRVDLPAALRLHGQPGVAALSQDQSRALAIFSDCVEAAWIGTTTEPWSPEILNALARLTSVWTFDPTGADARSMETMAAGVAAPGQSRALLTALFHICDTWTAQRGGADLPGLRQALMQEQVRLAAPPAYAQDIAALREHSAEIARALTRYESIDQGAGQIRVPRECQSSVLSAAETGSLLIIGEPGAGKSAVINTLARELRTRGDIVELAVDRYNVESLDGLRSELGLTNDLVKVLDAWDGPADGWLIIDALDATRGGRGEGAFRALIERVLALEGRWKVVASVRTFDLRMGIRFRELFPGQPPAPDYRDQSFGQVRHVRVPPWSKAEFDQILQQAPDLGQALDGAPRKLRELAEVPFNTRLINELLQSGIVAESLRALSNQAQLLRLYWDNRIEPLGASAHACLHGVASSMVEIRALRAPITAALQTYASALDALCQQGVLVRVENDRYVQFRHHLLFDYVASRLLLDMDGIVAGRSTFPKSEAKGLMLAPALGFLLQELWVSAPDRKRYWAAVEQVVGDHQGDPVLRSVAGRLSAELPETGADTRALAGDVRSGDAKAITVLGHVTAALAVRLEDDAVVLLPPWVSLAGELAGTVDRSATVLRFLLHLLLNVAEPPQISAETGAAARALLRAAFDTEEPAARASSLIPFVVATYTTDPAASRALLGVIFEPERLAGHSWEDVPAISREIGKLTAVSPDFVAQIYGFTFGSHADRDVVTRLGDSRILSLTSNARQDYASALYSLNEFFPDFLKNHPREAAAAFADAVDAYVARTHPAYDGEEREIITATVGARTIQVKCDLSHIWASDPDNQYKQDGEALIGKFAATLQTLPISDALAVCETLIAKSVSAVVWSRMFLTAARRGDELVDFLWPFAANSALLFFADTRKDATDVVAAGYSRRDLAAREALERAALAFDASGYRDPEAAKQHLLDRLFSTIGADQLVTNEAVAHIAAVPPDERPTNERPYRITTSWGSVGRFDWIKGLDRTVPANATMIAAIEDASDYFGLAPNQQDKPDVTAAQGLQLLETVAGVLDQADLDPELRIFGEGVIGEGCVCLARGERLVVQEGDPDLAERFLALLAIAAHSNGPTVEDDTEARFEESPSWGSPAPRVDAAVAVLDVCLQRPDIYPRLAVDVDELLSDPHPAARLQAISHLVRIWDIDREGFWARLGLRLEREANFGVLDHTVDLLRRVLHADHASTATSLFQLLRRFDGTANEARVANIVADLVAILAVTYSNPDAQATLTVWLDDPVTHKNPLHKIVATLRGAVAIGLRSGEGDETALRHRAQALMHSIVMTANRRLVGYDPGVVLPDDQVEALRACIELLDIAGMELYFATGRTNGGAGGLTDAGCAIFLQETAPTIERIGDSASPHTVYHLMQLIEILAPFGLATAFDLTAHAITAGGKLGGYQYESMGADLMVRLIGTFLADDKEIFEDEGRRQALVDCLEIFMEAGWTAARRLLYRLPELIQ
ncbi:MAG: hypothetical protein ACHP84_02730 [Caulobacterales bacterium]